MFSLIMPLLSLQRIVECIANAYIYPGIDDTRETALQRADSNKGVGKQNIREKKASLRSGMALPGSTPELVM